MRAWAARLGPAVCCATASGVPPGSSCTNGRCQWLKQLPAVLRCLRWCCQTAAPHAALAPYSWPSAVCPAVTTARQAGGWPTDRLHRLATRARAGPTRQVRKEVNQEPRKACPPPLPQHPPRAGSRCTTAPPQQSAGARQSRPLRKSPPRRCSWARACRLPQTPPRGLLGEQGCSGRAVGGGRGAGGGPPAGGTSARLVGPGSRLTVRVWGEGGSRGAAQPCMLGCTLWVHALPSPATAATWRRLLKLLRGAGRAWQNRARAEGAARCRVAAGRACTVTAAMAAMLNVALQRGSNGWPTPSHPVVCYACYASLCSRACCLRTPSLCFVDACEQS